jgi:hypothetical protein
VRDLFCIRCEKQLENIMEGRGVQPVDGLAFHSHGHYGTGIFDPMDGSYIEIVVCDECLEVSKAHGRVIGPKGYDKDYDWSAIDDSALAGEEQ